MKYDRDRMWQEYRTVPVPQHGNIDRTSFEMMMAKLEREHEKDVESAVAAEREACAQIAEQSAPCAALAIRARGAK